HHFAAPARDPRDPRIAALKVALVRRWYTPAFRDGREDRMSEATGSAREQEAPTTSIAPMLSVRRGAQAVEFYQAACGGSAAFRLDGPDGGVVARLSVAGAEFWVADESPEHGNFSPETLGGGTVRMVMVVADPDAAFARAVAAGA